MKENSYMNEALVEAQKALAQAEVPIGAVIVCNDQIIASAFNTCEADQNALRHAEIKALEEAAVFKGNWRLNDCDLYVTLEPCPMCLGALFQARVRGLYYGCADYKRSIADSAQSNYQSLSGVTEIRDNNHVLKVTGGVLEEECGALLKGFFQTRRQEAGGRRQKNEDQ